jgi:hypothetical protein
LLSHGGMAAVVVHQHIWSRMSDAEWAEKIWSRLTSLGNGGRNSGTHRRWASLGTAGSREALCAWNLYELALDTIGPIKTSGVLSLSSSSTVTTDHLLSLSTIRLAWPGLACSACLCQSPSSCCWCHWLVAPTFGYNY